MSKLGTALKKALAPTAPSTLELEERISELEQDNIILRNQINTQANNSDKVVMAAHKAVWLSLLGELNEPQWNRFNSDGIIEVRNFFISKLKGLGHEFKTFQEVQDEAPVETPVEAPTDEQAPNEPT
jgi:hypothetical protein